MGKRSLIGCRFVNLGDDISDNFDYYIKNEESDESGHMDSMTLRIRMTKSFLLRMWMKMT
jgi:hypothetical protein